MTKKEFFTERTAIKLKHAGKVAALKEDYARELSELTDEMERINLTMEYRAKMSKAEMEFQSKLLELRQRELMEAAEGESKEAAEQEANEAKEQESGTVWPDGSWWSAVVTAKRVLGKVHPRLGESLSLSIHYQDGEGWWVNVCHIGGVEPHTLYLSKRYPVKNMEEDTRKFAANVNGDKGEPLFVHFTPSATGLQAFDDALNAVIGEKKGGNNE